MSLTRNLYFFRGTPGPQPRRREVMDALVARLPELEQRHRIATYGAVRVAFNDFDWMLRLGGAATLLDPPVEAFTVAIRPLGQAPVYLTPLDLLSRFHALGWIPAEQIAHLPPEALEPPREDDAISLDHIALRCFPPGSTFPLADPDEMRQRTTAFVEAVRSEIAVQRARDGALDEQGEP